MGTHDPVGQAARKFSGFTAEHLVRGILQKDPKLRGWTFDFSPIFGEGLDIKLDPPNPCSQGETPGCRLPLQFEAKSVEKLFEQDSKVGWPHNRSSRFVLKRGEGPDCYVFVTRDEITDMTAVDFVAGGGELSEWKKKQGGKSQKLPVRALPRLRLRPCPYVTKSTHVVKEGREYD